jgi:hypothetical protein
MCWQQVNPVLGAQVELGPPLSVSHWQLPSVFVWRQAYVPQLQVSPAPGHPRSAQQTPFATLVLEHAGPLSVLPDSSVHSHCDVPAEKQLPPVAPVIPPSGDPHAPRTTAASAVTTAKIAIGRPMRGGT